MADIHGRAAADSADDAPWGIVCFPGDCMSPVIVFSYPPAEAAAASEDVTGESPAN
jgi:hypothetical protein